MCKHRDRWKAFRSHLGTGRMEVYDAELWAIGLALRESVKKRETLQTHSVMKVAVLSDLQAAIRRTEHLELLRSFSFALNTGGSTAAQEPSTGEGSTEKSTGFQDTPVSLEMRKQIAKQI